VLVGNPKRKDRYWTNALGKALPSQLGFDDARAGSRRNIRVILSPARASKDSNSRAVRSAPRVNVIITMSARPNRGALRLRSTSSMMSNRLVGVMAARQFGFQGFGDLSGDPSSPEWRRAVSATPSAAPQYMRDQTERAVTRGATHRIESRDSLGARSDRARCSNGFYRADRRRERSRAAPQFYWRFWLGCRRRPRGEGGGSVEG